MQVLDVRFTDLQRQLRDLRRTAPAYLADLALAPSGVGR